VIKPRSWAPDLLGVFWVVASAGAVLLPTLIHGASLGPYDLLTKFGLSKQAGVVVLNAQRGDLITAINSWTTVAWRQVHDGQLPLWNPYSALGMPLAFNWQSAPFSVPALVGYLVPLRLDFTAQTTVTLVIAGTGVYTLGRILRLGVIGCAFAATAFELSGPMVGWLGWPHAAVMSWTGWLFVATLLVIRGRRRLFSISFFAVIVACAVYAGQPEILLFLGLTLVIFVVILLVQRVAMLGGSGPILRPIGDLAIAGMAGLALGAPLLIPGLEVASGSLRSAHGPDQALPGHNLVYLMFQGFDGLPVAGSHWFGYVLGYAETAAYVGVIALVLAVMAVALCRRRPEVIALAVVGFVMAAIAFVAPVNTLLDGLPVIGHVLWHRSLLPMSFAIAVLAGVGMDLLVRRGADRAVRYWAGAGFAAVALVLVALWVLGRGHLPPTEAAIRARSFVWPTIEAIVGLVVVGALTLVSRHRLSRDDGAGNGIRRGAGRVAGLALLACETGFLIAAGAPIMSSSPTFFAPTPAIASLRRTVGSSVVGLGANSLLCSDLGIIPNVNAVFGVQELALYDPMVPSPYFSSFRALTGRAAGVPAYYAYCPALTTVSLARLYGVAYILEPSGTPGPTGTMFVTHLGLRGAEEDLYRAPGAVPATLTPLPVGGGLPADDASGTPVPVPHPNPA